MRNENILKVGIAGYGVVGQRRRLYLDIHPRLKTVAVCDQKFNGSEVMDDGVCYSSNYHDLLKEELDILFVSLPNYLAAEVTIAGLEKGLHVFCEKPPGRTVAEVERVTEVEKRNPDCLLKYGFNHRYHDSVREALRIVQSKELGNIINLRGVYGKSKIISFSSGWRAQRKYSGGGILLDQGIHMIDLMRLFCGEFIEVKSFISNRYWKHDVEDNAYVIMRDRNGRVAILHSSATQWQHKFLLDIALTKGFIELHGILSGSKSYGEEKLIVGLQDESDFGSQWQKTIKYLEDNSWRHEINEFVGAITSKRKIKYGNSQDALATMKLVYRIYYSDCAWRRKFKIPNYR